MNRNDFLLCIALACTVSACKKEEIDLDTLTTNPFDAAYNGTAIFTLADQSTSEITIGGNSFLRLEATIAVHTELFPLNTSYSVQATRSSDGAVQQFSLNAQSGGHFSLRADGGSPGDVFCWDLNLINTGVLGGGNSVCATVE